jgi:hypothetical protein
MHARRTAVLALSVVGALGLAACGSSSTSTTTTAAAPTTTGGVTPTTTGSGSGTATSSSTLCRDLADLSTQEEGLVRAQQTATDGSGSLSALQSYAKQAKSAFDQSGPRITADLATSPTIVRSAWSTLQPQLDQLVQSAATSTSVPAFARAASSIETSNSFLASDQTLTAYTKAACPTAVAG